MYTHTHTHTHTHTLTHTHTHTHTHSWWFLCWQAICLSHRPLQLGLCIPVTCSVFNRFSRCGILSYDDHASWTKTSQNRLASILKSSNDSFYEYCMYVFPPAFCKNQNTLMYMSCIVNPLDFPCKPMLIGPLCHFILDIDLISRM